jgi:hypothetical membrane protein
MSRLLKAAGICGIAAPAFAFACILAAVGSWQQFSWTGNALSDLGVQTEPTAIVFNSGLVACGVLCLAFAAGIFRLLGKRFVGKVGVFLFVLACVFLVSIGVFNENYSPTHYYVSVGFFVSLPISVLVLVAALWLTGEHRLSVVSLVLGFAAAVPWILQFTVPYVSGVAVPEFASGLAGAVWAMQLSAKMLKTSGSKTPRD